MSSSPWQYLTAVHEHNITFSNMVGTGTPGTYELMIVFESEVIENLTVVIEVRECIIGEVIDPGTEMCLQLHSTVSIPKKTDVGRVLQTASA